MSGKNRHSEEINMLQECSNILQNAVLNKPEGLNDVDLSMLKAAFLVSITHEL